MDHSQDPPPGISSGSAGGIASFRDDKQETVVVRPYPQVQALGQPPALPQHVPIQPSPPVTVAAPSVQLLQGQQSSFSEGSVKVTSFHFLCSCDFVEKLCASLKLSVPWKCILHQLHSDILFREIGTKLILLIKSQSTYILSHDIVIWIMIYRSIYTHTHLHTLCLDTLNASCESP